VAEELERESRLALAGRSDDRDEVRPAVARRPFPEIAEQPELASPSDERHARQLALTLRRLWRETDLRS